VRRSPASSTREQVSPAVVFLASERCTFSGKVLECSGGKFSVARWTSSETVDLGREPVAPAVIEERWADIEGACRVKSRRPPSIIESFNFAFEGIIHVLRTQRNMRIHFRRSRCSC
jgi:hypothetical protein